MQKLIKIYGERNTNTNYLSKLIELNLNIREVPGVTPLAVMKIEMALPWHELVRDFYFYFTYAKNLGWKHTCVKPQAELDKYQLVNANLVFLTITKNPYAWLLSLHCHPYNQQATDGLGSFEVFLQRQWRMSYRDGINATLGVDAMLPNPMELWNIKNKSYLQLDNKQTINTTTEAIFADPEAIIQQMSQQYSIHRKSAKFINYERCTKNNNKNNAYYRDYYLAEKWRDHLSKESIAMINESIDKELMAYFGYSILS